MNAVKKSITYINPPEVCDICHESLEKATVFYDARTVMGPWANMCAPCYRKYGQGRLGVGLGQKYRRGVYSDVWRKAED